MALSRQGMVKELIRLAQQYQVYGVSHTLVEDLRCSGVKTFATRMLIVCANNPRGSPFYPKLSEMAQEVCILSLRYHDFKIAATQVDELVSWMPDDVVYRMVGRNGGGKSRGEVRVLLKDYVRTQSGYLNNLQVGDLQDIRPRRIYELLMADH